MLVLNATYEPINVCTVRRATVLLLKDKAEVVEVGTRDLHWATGSLPRPVVIRLVTYVRIPRDTHKRKITRRAVFARDGWMCQYCGARTSLTVDHVIPRSKGGGSGWDNIVASCAPCNRRKADRLPHQINMHPRTKPHTPGAHIFIQLGVADDPGDLAAVPPARGLTGCTRPRRRIAPVCGASTAVPDDQRLARGPTVAMPRSPRRRDDRPKPGASASRSLAWRHSTLGIATPSRAFKSNEAPVDKPGPREQPAGLSAASELSRRPGGLTPASKTAVHRCGFR